MSASVDAQKGIYAGKAFGDSGDYNPSYGSVNHNCGDSCVSDWEEDDGLDDSTGGGDAYYALCYEDELGVIKMEVAYVCNQYANACDGDSACISAVYSCYGDEECYLDAVCGDDDDCKDELADSIEQYSGRRLKYQKKQGNNPSRKQETTTNNLDALTISTGVVIKGLGNTGSELPVYLDHEHLYNFGYE